ncbi:AcrR family transcriptional regulator [Kibdelosporangium banguiense]|uniref:AcrR family transcriptional regulator n=1 Tax=Kibdelosporangium banguiense TaxID=1365924 RepID=A0ABS4TIM0_9PSEU|nr:TetR-like C-terminal domain-containing protein [Kibdelosporangium banguiense]MBP2324201.1 AcrR family transcriptional regulator [Kibdelosporangium banguiense]
MQPSGPAKRGYHHGDLRNALVEAAAQLAEEGGPQAVTVRAAARAAGVTPTAAYRHFENQEQLLTAAKECAMDGLASTMQEFIDAMPPIDDPVRLAMSTLGAIARGYVYFAMTEAGLFRTAFEQGGTILEGTTLAKVDSGFQMLVQGLDKLVEVGHLSAEHRPLAEITAWSAAHGFAMLVIDGPMHDWPPDMLNDALERMLGIFVRGLTSEGADDQLTAHVLADTRRG